MDVLAYQLRKLCCTVETRWGLDRTSKVGVAVTLLEGDLSDGFLTDLLCFFIFRIEVLIVSKDILCDIGCSLSNFVRHQVET